MVDNAKFYWGDVVIVNDIADSEFPKGVKGTVCGITQIINEHLEKLYGQPLGSFIYTVEFSNGQSFGVPEAYLEKDSNG